MPEGTWGGRGIRLVVTGSGGSVEYDCGLGSIGQPLITSTSGEFSTAGTYTAESGGPAGPGAPPSRTFGADYRGRVEGTRMQLTVTRADNGSVVGSFTLGLGEAPLLSKCV